jgi:hypothetical protein
MLLFSGEGPPASVARSRITETVTAPGEDIVLSWFDFLPAFNGATSADPKEGRGHGAGLAWSETWVRPANAF